MNVQSDKHLQTSSYAVIPSFVMDNEELDDGAKMLYARISMYSKEGRCWASNAHFAEKHKVTVRCIQKWLAQLSKEGYIEIEVSCGGFQTERNIWIINDFKKMYKGRTVVHPPPNCSSPPTELQFTPIYKDDNYKKDNYKKREEAMPPNTPQFTHKRVHMDVKKHEALVAEYGKEKIDEMIGRLDEYADLNPKRFKQYACHATVIRKWIREDKTKETSPKKDRKFLPSSDDSKAYETIKKMNERAL